MNSVIPNDRKRFLDEHASLKVNLHHLAYSVPILELFPECIKYWTYDKHGIYMGYTEQEGLTEYIYPTSNNSLIRGVLVNEGMVFDHFCFAISPKDYPFNLLKVTDKFYSDLWGCDVQFFYDKLNDLKIELIWL
jgi:hypothetical protein